MKSRLVKKITLLLTCALVLPIFASCGEGGESSSEPEAESSATADFVQSVTIGNSDFDLSGIDTDSREHGIYLYTSAFGAAAEKLSETDKDFFDVALVNGVVAAIYSKGSTAPIPANGFVLRFRGQGEPEFAVGNTARGDALRAPYLAPKHFKSGDTAIEIGRENTERTSENTAFLFDYRWYSGTTCTNAFGTEIAVKDGVITEITFAGNGGSMKIPADGYVVSLPQGSTAELLARNLKVGDPAELVLEESLYSARRITHSGMNRQTRPENGITVYTDETDTTPIGQNLTEVIVDASGRVTAVLTGNNGMNAVPKGGFIISATATEAVNLGNLAGIGMDAALDGNRNLCLITTPITELARLKAEHASLLAEYEKQVEKLSHIDFELVAGLISQMSGKINAAEATLGTLESDTALEEHYGFDGAILAEAVTRLQRLATQCKKELVPSLSVQDRTAWVTLGEHNYDGSVIVHYRSLEEIAHTVAYAKSLNLNTLIIDNIAAGYAVYPSKIGGMVRLPGCEDIDYIQAFSEECKKQNIRLIVMVNSFSSAFMLHKFPENHYINIYKDKWLKTNKGGTLGPDNITTLDPADPVIQEFNLSIIKEIAENYGEDIFGIQADYMRYPLPYYYQEHNYEDFGYNESSASGFKAKYGVDPATLKISDPLWKKWCAWRRDIISDYQKRFYQTIKAVNPNLNVSFTCFADYNDRQKYVYQDVEKWAENGYVDALYPMIYGETTEYQLGYAEQILGVTEHTDLILGVGTYVRATQESMQEQLYMPFELCAEGSSNFTLRYISTCGYDETVRNSFRVQATPATASGLELTNALSSMLKERTKTLRYATRFSGESANEALLNALTDLGEEIEAFAKALSDNSTAESALSAKLNEIKAAIESGKTSVPESVKTAFLQDLAYALGILN